MNNKYVNQFNSRQVENCLKSDDKIYENGCFRPIKRRLDYYSLILKTFSTAIIILKVKNRINKLFFIVVSLIT